MALTLTSCYRYWRTHPVAETDEHGSYSLQLPVSGLKIRLRAEWKSAGRSWWDQSEPELVGEKGTQIDLEVRERRGQ